MRKIFLFAAMAAIAASSCTKVDEEAIGSAQTNDGAISFGLSTSRVTTNTITELQGMEPQIESYSTTGEYASASAIEAHMVDRNLYYTNNRWAVNGIYFWPESTSAYDNISFFSTTADDTNSPLAAVATVGSYPSFYYAVKSDTATQQIDANGAVTTAMAEDDNNMEDILVAQVMNQTSGQVNLSYQHAMSRVNFKIQGEDNGGSYKAAAKDPNGNYYTDDQGKLLYQETYNGYLVYADANGVEYYKNENAYYTCDGIAYAGVTVLDYLTDLDTTKTLYLDTTNGNALVYSSDATTYYDYFTAEEYTATGAAYNAITIDPTATYYINTADNNTVIYKKSTYYAVADDAVYTGSTALTAVDAEEVDIDYAYTLKYIKIGGLASTGTFTFNGADSYDTVPGSWAIEAGDAKDASYGYYFTPDTQVTNTGVADLRIFDSANYIDPTNSIMIIPQGGSGNADSFTITARYAVSSPGLYGDVNMSTNGGIDGNDQSAGTSANIADAKAGEIYIATVTAKISLDPATGYAFNAGESTTITVVLPSPGDLVTFEAGVGSFEEKSYTVDVDSVESVDDNYVVVVKLPSETI